jgi:hypothetical protein
MDGGARHTAKVVPTRAHRLYVAVAAAAMMACAHHEWRPKFDATCDCTMETTTKTAETAAPESMFHANASMADVAIARLAGTPSDPDPAVTIFLTDPSAFDDAIARMLEKNRVDVVAAAEDAANGVEVEVVAVLRALRRELAHAKTSDDANAVAEAKSLMWTRYDDGLALVHDEATAAARVVYPRPVGAITVECVDVSNVLLSDVPLAADVQVARVRNRLGPYLMQRWFAARDAAVEDLVAPMVAARRLRFVAAMHDST